MKKFTFLILFSLFVFSKTAFAADFTVHEKIDYNNQTKTVSVTGEIQVTKTGDYELFLDYVRPIDSGKNQNQLVYKKRTLKAGQADIFTYNISSVNTNEIINLIYTNTGTKESVTKKITIPSVAQTVPSLPNIKPITGLSSTGEKHFDFYFEPNQCCVETFSDKLGLSGYILLHKQIPNPKILISLGKSESDLSGQHPINFNGNLQQGVVSQWGMLLTKLQPNTKYYFIFENGDEKNPDKKILGELVFSATTKPADNSNNQKLPDDLKTVFPDSPAQTDNTGKDGIFSYRYPTNTGNPGTTAGYSLDEGDKSIVPECSYGDLSSRCSFKHLMVLIGNIIDFLLILILPTIAILAVIVGIMMIKDRSNPVKLGEHKKVVTRIVVGILVILLSWTLVATVINTVIGDEAKRYVLLDLASLK